MADYGYVFDTEPLVAYLYGESGSADVRELLEEVESEITTAAISHATATETVYKVARLETGNPNESTPTDDDIETGEQNLRVLRGFGLSVETPSWRAVAPIKASGGISLADSYAAGLALETGATLVVGADPEFDGIDAEIDLLRVRGTA